SGAGLTNRCSRRRPRWRVAGAAELLVMQLILIDKRFVCAGCILLVTCLFFVACNKTNSLPIRVSLCQLYAHPEAYNGKLIQVAATVTGLPDGTYVYPGTVVSECGYSFIKVDAGHVENPAALVELALVELKTPAGSPPERKELDVELTGTFDSNYSEPWDHFRYRIIALEIKPVSSVRIGKRLGAA